MQKDIDRLASWSHKWSMHFNIDKCKIMHFGKHNSAYKYKMENADGSLSELVASNEEKDVGIILTNKLKRDVQVKTATAKANKMLGMVANSFNKLDDKILKTLYCAFVRPQLEFY